MDLNRIKDSNILVISSFLPQLLPTNQNPPSLVTVIATGQYIARL